MRCKACNIILENHELSRKDKITGSFSTCAALAHNTAMMHYIDQTRLMTSIVNILYKRSLHYRKSMVYYYGNER